MVIPADVVKSILESEAWNDFINPDGAGSDSYQQYKNTLERMGQRPSDRDRFLTDRALRFLVADFVRRDHHERGKATLEMHAFLKTLVDQGDRLAFETISDIGVAHGLDDSELSDKSRFPESRIVFGEKVNVRFLARLLRIGDLLDVSTSRTDPLAAIALGPFPPDAKPHWLQYHLKRHENISPDEIAFRFECEDQETHRVLRDWFGWLENEVRNTAYEQVRSVRHGNWRPPPCVVESKGASRISGQSSGSTISIEPSKSATYTFHNWRLELES